MNLGQFFGLRGIASNVVPTNTKTYTQEMFLEDFPQFGDAEHASLIPANVWPQFIVMANAAIQEARWFEKWRWAMGLYIAHYSTLYLRGYADGSPNSMAAANSGAVIGTVASATLGDASVTYDTKAIVAATEKWGAWNSTTYGQLLVTEARLVGMGGTYII
jgi:hypothetical protein